MAPTHPTDENGQSPRDNEAEAGYGDGWQGLEAVPAGGPSLSGAWMTFHDNVPNLLTLLSLATAVLSLQALVWGEPGMAARLILICVLLDGMDGTLARQMHLTSPMGKQLDSLADLVAFGAAPAALLAAGPLSGQMHLAALGGIVFAAAGAFRLARYNIEDRVGGFSGLPITAAGGALAAVASAPFALPELAYLFVALSLAALMVSRVPYGKSGSSSSRTRPSYLIWGGPAGLLGCVFLPGPLLAGLFGTLFGGYTVAGVLAAVWRHRPAPLRDRLGTS